MSNSVVDHRRADWLQGRPWSAPRIRPELLDRIVIHYPGSAKPPSKPAAWMRQVHDARDYAFYYNFAVDVAGEVWEGRGFDCKNAANKGSNDQTVSICVHTYGGEPVNQKQVEAVRRLVGELRNRFGGLTIVGHRDVGATACPGDGVYRQVKTNMFELVAPAPEPEPAGGGDVEMIVLDWRPGTQHWVACLWTGETLAHIVNGHADAVLRRVKTVRTTVNDDELAGVIRSSKTIGAAPGPLTDPLKSLWAGAKR